MQLIGERGGRYSLTVGRDGVVDFPELGPIAVAGMRFWRISVGLYLLMGWMAVLVAPNMIGQLPPAALGLLIACGLCYTAGVPFFMQEHMRYAHAIWHLFVIGGSVFHYMAVLLYAT